jgi:hypothetical protein
MPAIVRLIVEQPAMSRRFRARPCVIKLAHVTPSKQTNPTRLSYDADLRPDPEPIHPQVTMPTQLADASGLNVEVHQQQFLR